MKRISSLAVVWTVVLFSLCLGGESFAASRGPSAAATPEYPYTADGRKFAIDGPPAYMSPVKLNRYKVQLHSHSSNSPDVPKPKTESPAALLTAYRDAGYAAVAITDHDYVTPNPGVEGITWLGKSVEDSVYKHINAWDISDRAKSAKNTQEVIDFHRKRGELCSLNHPMQISRYELINYKDYNITEIYNSETFPFIDDARYDWVLSAGHRVWADAVDDCHDVTDQGHFNKGWVEVMCLSNTKKDILAALREGDFYAVCKGSNNFNVSVNGRTVTATTADPSVFEFITRDGVVIKTEKGVTAASYTIQGYETYVRAKATRLADGAVSWGQPVWIDVKGGDDGRLPADLREDITPSYLTRNLLTNPEPEIWSGPVQKKGPADGDYLADDWRVVVGKGNVSDITHTKAGLWLRGLFITSGSRYAYKVTADKDVSRVSLHGIAQRIANGTSLLANADNKVTVSFRATCKLQHRAVKKVGVFLRQNYGSGSEFGTKGSPQSSPEDIIPGTYFNVTGGGIGEFTYFTHTFNLSPVLWKRSFAANNTDYLELNIVFLWDKDNAPLVGDTEAEDFPAGWLEITQVQLNVGGKALPWQPVFHQEAAAQVDTVTSDTGFRVPAKGDLRVPYFPSNPKEGMTIYHTRYKTKFIYESDAWKALESFSYLLLYVDGTKGLDSPGKGFAKGAGACKTIQYALDNLVPPRLGGNVVIYVAPGTYRTSGANPVADIDKKYPMGNYTIAVEGSMSPVLGPAAVVASGPRKDAANPGWVSIGKDDMAVNAYQYKLLKVTFKDGNARYYPVISNDSANIYVEDLGTITDGSCKVEVLDWDTRLTGLKAEGDTKPVLSNVVTVGKGQGGVTLQFLKVDYAQNAAVHSGYGSDVTVLGCDIGHGDFSGVNGADANIRVKDTCFHEIISPDGGAVVQSGGRSLVDGCLFTSTVCNGIRVKDGGNCTPIKSRFNGQASMGIFADNGGIVLFSPAKESYNSFVGIKGEGKAAISSEGPAVLNRPESNYFSDNTMNIQQRLTAPSSGWDTGGILLGNYHLWIDGGGNLRIKGSQPLSDTDGKIVGTQ